MVRPALDVDQSEHRLTRQRRLEPRRLRVGQQQRGEGVAPGHDRAGGVDGQQQLVAGVAFAVVGEEVAHRGGVGAHQRHQVRERRQQPGDQRQALVAGAVGGREHVAAADEISGHPFAHRLVGQPADVGQRGAGEADDERADGDQQAGAEGAEHVPVSLPEGGARDPSPERAAWGTASDPPSPRRGYGNAGGGTRFFVACSKA